MRRYMMVGAAAVVGAGLFVSGMAFGAAQPHMDAALNALLAAKQEILAADSYHDHGGHAGNATALIDQAIREVHLGIEFRNQHGP